MRYERLSIALKKNLPSTGKNNRTTVPKKFVALSRTLTVVLCFPFDLFLEAASIEDDDDMQTRWAALLC
jgi:hypothetical protein